VRASEKRRRQGRCGAEPLAVLFLVGGAGCGARSNHAW